MNIIEHGGAFLQSLPLGSVLCWRTVSAVGARWQLEAGGGVAWSDADPLALPTHGGRESTSGCSAELSGWHPERVGSVAWLAAASQRRVSAP